MKGHKINTAHTVKYGAGGRTMVYQKNFARLRHKQN